MILKLFIIFFITLIHFGMLNFLEKILYQLYIGNSSRPNKECNNLQIPLSFRCLGMPSGHTESATIFALLLYYLKYINLPTAIFIIIIFGLQRIISNRHSYIQVFIGFLLGFFYSYIYRLTNISIISLLIAISLYFIYIFLIIIKINQLLNDPIPNWVDPSLKNLIIKKINVSLLSKFLHVSHGLLRINKNYLLYCNWQELENNLDQLIIKIKKTNINFDAIVGIKSGGAIIANYISKKMNIKKYYIKLSKKQYNCNKSSYNMINDVYDRKMDLDNEYIICEDIKDNIENKKIILIDELISTGETMYNTINYLKNIKRVSYVLPTTLYVFEDRFKYNFHNINVSKNKFIIWPWGFEN